MRNVLKISSSLALVFILTFAPEARASEVEQITPSCEGSVCFCECPYSVDEGRCKITHREIQTTHDGTAAILTRKKTFFGGDLGVPPSDALSFNCTAQKD